MPRRHFLFSKAPFLAAQGKASQEEAQKAQKVFSTPVFGIKATPGLCPRLLSRNFYTTGRCGRVVLESRCFFLVLLSVLFYAPADPKEL